MTQKNPSFVLHSPGNVQYEDRPVPELKSPYDVLVQPRWTGICGSDVLLPPNPLNYLPSHHTL